MAEQPLAGQQPVFCPAFLHPNDGTGCGLARLAERVEALEVTMNGTPQDHSTGVVATVQRIEDMLKFTSRTTVIWIKVAAWFVIALFMLVGLYFTSLEIRGKRGDLLPHHGVIDLPQVLTARMSHPIEMSRKDW